MCFCYCDSTGSTGPAGDHTGAPLHHVQVEEEGRRKRSHRRMEVCRYGRRSHLPLHFHHVHHHRHAGRPLLGTAHHRAVKKK